MTHGASDIESRRARRLLSEVDWSFASARTQDGTHGVHPYPAKFIPQIPRKLIELFPPESGTVVLDPFCGSGTTLVEAQAAGYSAVGVDLNPIATLISRVKTHPPDRPALPSAQRIVDQCRNGAAAQIPEIPRLDHWFLPHVQQSLANLTVEINKTSNEALRDTLSLALSAIIVRVSNQESDTRYAAITKEISGGTVYELFLKSTGAIDTAHEAQFGSLFSSLPLAVEVFTDDVLSLEPAALSRPAGLVITSPPYPNAYEYWLYHKYRMYWLGMDPISVRELEVGARPHYFKKNHQTAADFEQQMEQVFRLLRTVTVPGAVICVLVGRSIIHGQEIDNASLVERAANTSDITLAGKIDRPIRKERKSFNLSHAKIRSESLLVFVR